MIRELALHISHICGEPIEAARELACDLDCDGRVVSEEVIWRVDLPNHGRHDRRDSSGAGLLQERTDFANNRSRHAVSVDHDTAAFHLQLSLDEHQDRGERISLAVDDLVGSEVS